MKVKEFLRQAKALLDMGTYTDGCTLIFGLQVIIHKVLPKSKLLCAAHDFGGEGLIDGVKAGWQNNWYTWLAHFYYAPFNPVYWVWGTIVSVWTLPWVVWYHNWNIRVIENSIGFSVIQFMLIAIYFLVKYK